VGRGHNCDILCCIYFSPSSMEVGGGVVMCVWLVRVGDGPVVGGCCSCSSSQRPPPCPTPAARQVAARDVMMPRPTVKAKGPSWLDVRPCLWLCGSNVAGSAKRSEILPRHPAKIYWQRLAARRAQAHPTSTYRVPAPSAICHLPTLDPFPPPSPTIPYSVYVPRFLNPAVIHRLPSHEGMIPPRCLSTTNALPIPD
jgi:hypothetical protein